MSDESHEEEGKERLGLHVANLGKGNNSNFLRGIEKASSFKVQTCCCHYKGGLATLAENFTSFKKQQKMLEKEICNMHA